MREKTHVHTALNCIICIIISPLKLYRSKKKNQDIKTIGNKRAKTYFVRIFIDIVFVPVKPIKH